MTRPGRDVETTRGRGLPRVDGRWLVVAAAVVITALMAWRATIGMSLVDDGYYAATTVRLAQGARIFADEMFVQSLGFLAAIPFAKLWLWLFGQTGVVLALRLFYVAVAAVGGVVVYRMLHRYFGRTAAFAGAAAILIAPAYNLLAISYDTMAALGMVLACVFAFAAVRDSDWRFAAIAGAAAAIASVSHPPMTLAALALLATLAARTRNGRLVGAMALGAASVVAAFTVWLLLTTSFNELRGAADFILGSWRLTSGPATGTRGEIHLWRFIVSLIAVWQVPLFVWFAPAAGISFWAAFPGREPGRARSRGIALALLPLALVLPVVANWGAHGWPMDSLWTVGGNFLIAMVVFSAAPMFMSLHGARTDIRRDLTILAFPAGVVGFAVVIMSSSADIFWASGVVGLAPLVVAVVVWWATEVRGALGTGRENAAVAFLLAALIVMLFGYAFNTNGTPTALPATITTGAYAGLKTGAQTAAEVADLERLGQKWIKPTSTVTIVGLPGAYLATGGRALTNVTWLDPGQFDIFTVAYLYRVGRWPDVVIVPLTRLRIPDGEPPTTAVTTSPFLSAVVGHYTLVDTSEVSGVAVFTTDGLDPILQ
jgi:hypothetical protein